MIRASVDGLWGNGRTLIILGLTDANLEHLRSAPGTSYLKSEDGKIDITIFYGKTEADCVKVLEPFIDSHTKVVIDSKLKN